MPESGTYFRPAELPGIEALHASFIEHAYRPHSHPTWTVAVIERGAARFEVDDTNLGITSIYLQGIDNAEIIDALMPIAAIEC